MKWKLIRVINKQQNVTPKKYSTFLISIPACQLNREFLIVAVNGSSVITLILARPTRNVCLWGCNVHTDNV